MHRLERNTVYEDEEGEVTPWPHAPIEERWPYRPEHDGDLWAVLVENPHLPSLSIVIIGLSDSFDTALNLAYREAENCEHEDAANLILNDLDEECDKIFENGDGIVYMIQRVGVYVR